MGIAKKWHNRKQYKKRTRNGKSIASTNNFPGLGKKKIENKPSKTKQPE